MKKKYIIILVTLIVIIGAIITIGVIIKHLGTGLSRLADLTISNVDLSEVKDGIYTGSYKAFPVTAEVSVIVENNKITRIDLIKHNNGQGTPAEAIPGKVVEAQSLDVDIVTGATYSSKVILKAIENALIKAKK